MDFPGVEVAAAYAIMTIACFIAAIFEKNYRYLCFMIGVIGIAGTAMCAISLRVQSKQLFILSSFVPAGVLMIALGLNTIIGYKKCTESIMAEFIGSHSGRYKGNQWRFPKFRYWYKGASYESIGLVSYPPEQFDKLFQNDRVRIYINPKKPARCADKLQSPMVRSVSGIVIGGFCIALAIIACVFSGMQG